MLRLAVRRMGALGPAIAGVVGGGALTQKRAENADLYDPPNDTEIEEAGQLLFGEPSQPTPTEKQESPTIQPAILLHPDPSVRAYILAMGKELAKSRVIREEIQRIMANPPSEVMASLPPAVRERWQETLVQRDDITTTSTATTATTSAAAIAYFPSAETPSADVPATAIEVSEVSTEPAITAHTIESGQVGLLQRLLGWLKGMLLRPFGRKSEQGNPVAAEPHETEEDDERIVGIITTTALMILGAILLRRAVSHSFFTRAIRLAFAR